MRLCYSWLKELTSFDWSPEELADRLSLSGTETKVEGPLFPSFSGVIVGKVEDCAPHPSSNHLMVCKVDVGSAILTSLCGAPNVRPGLKVAFAAPGAELPGGVKVSAVEKLGVKSEGMICSEAELGISDDHSVVLELGRDSKTGASVRESLDLDDWLLEFETTPNRPDCLSAIGLAREIAALAASKLEPPKFDLSEIDEDASTQLEIIIERADLCPRYLARIIRDVTVGTSPWWIRRKLCSAGIRSINNIVDITNLVLIEYGHPLHAFDFDKFTAPKVLVRSATQGEKFTTLDGVERNLADGIVMITDSLIPVAVGGVMGGRESEVTAVTTNVLLESAYFDPKAIRRAGKQLGLTSEAQTRFEKGADPNCVPRACDRAAHLMQVYAGGKVLRGRVDCYPNPIEPARIKLRPTRVNQLLATDLSSPQMIDIMTSLDFGVRTGKELDVTVPTFRPDISREIDLVEEIARIYGYERIKTSACASGTLVTRIRREDSFHDQIRQILVSQGCVEALTNTLIDPVKDKVISELEEYVRVKNPISAELSVMRRNMVASFLGIISYNLNRKKQDIGFFEIGRVFDPSQDELPSERTVIGIAVCGIDQTAHWDRKTSPYDFYDLKGLLESLAAELRLGRLELRPAKTNYFEQALSYAIIMGGTDCGVCGQVSSKASQLFDLDTPVYFAEIEIGKIFALASSERIFASVPKYPSSIRDIAVIVDSHVMSEDLRTEIVKQGGKLIVRVDLFDVYEGKQIPSGKRSLAYSIEYRADDRTLTDEEIDTVHNRIVGILGEKFFAELRT